MIWDLTFSLFEIILIALIYALFFYLSTELEKRNIDKPYIFSEFGVIGAWAIKEEKTHYQNKAIRPKLYPLWFGNF